MYYVTALLALLGPVKLVSGFVIPAMEHESELYYASEPGEKWKTADNNLYTGALQFASGAVGTLHLDGETLGSKVCERIEGNASPAEFEFILFHDELPAERIDSLKLDLYAAEKTGEDYSFCGSASIERPQAGNLYTMKLSGDTLHGLALRFLNG